MVFCTKMQQFIDTSQTLYQATREVSKEINHKCIDLAKSMNILSECFSRLSDLNKVVKLQKSTQLFNSLSKIIHGTGASITNTGELIKLYCGSHLKYHHSEQESLRELLNIRMTLHNSYLKKERALFLKKEKLFAAKNPTKWGYTKGPIEELVGRSDELFKNKAKAFKFMLTEET